MSAMEAEQGSDWEFVGGTYTGDIHDQSPFPTKDRCPRGQSMEPGGVLGDGRDLERWRRLTRATTVAL